MPTHYSGTRAQLRSLDTFIKLTRCTNSVLGRLAERNTIGDLTWSEFAVLEALYHLGSMTQGEVTVKVLKSGSNITTVIDNLERDGLVRRERDVQDRRVIHDHLTDAGRRWVKTVLPGHVAALVEEFSVLLVRAMILCWSDLIQPGDLPEELEREEGKEELKLPADGKS